MAKVRAATPDDVELILSFIWRVAEYEHLEHEVVATPELLKEWLFDKKKAEVLFALNDEGKEVGMALFFHNFSTFLGRAGIYLEDLFVLPEARGQGYGTLLLRALAKLCVERGCGRLEWSCLKWNTPSLNFYQNLGAKPLEEWVMLRVTGDTLQDMGS